VLERNDNVLTAGVITDSIRHAVISVERSCCDHRETRTSELQSEI